MGAGARSRVPFSSSTGANNEQNASVGETFEFLLAEWHLSPDYILAHWTEELFIMMIDKLIKRKKREAVILGGRSPSQSIPDEQFFKQAGIKVVKK